MNILITGMHGFVGSNLVVALKELHNLYGLDIVAPEKEGVVKTFSWKDIERYLMMNEFEWERIMYSFDASPDRIYIYPKTNVSVEDIEHVFQQIFPANFSLLNIFCT